MRFLLKVSGIFAAGFPVVANFFLSYAIDANPVEHPWRFVLFMGWCLWSGMVGGAVGVRIYHGGD